MKLRSRAIPEPLPLPPVLSSLELEASLFDSGVQELFEPKDVGGLRTGDALLQWPALTEFPGVVGLFELNCTAVPLPAVQRGCGPSGAAHHSDSCGCEFYQDSADLKKSQLEIVSEVPGEFIEFSPDERPLHTPSRIRSTSPSRSVSSICDALAPQLLQLAGVLSMSITVLGLLRSARSLEEEFGVNPGVTSMKP